MIRSKIKDGVKQFKRILPTPVLVGVISGRISMPIFIVLKFYTAANNVC